jgi:DNA (cytosine-5)-methyltransferase 1
MSKRKLRALDLFAGVGGSSLGATLAGVEVAVAVDNWSLARQTYLDNFDRVKYYGQKCETLSPERVKKDVGKIDMILASPECTNHTCAKGSSARSESSRRTAFQVVKFAAALSPRWIIVENVVHMRSWKRYYEWIAQLVGLGYNLRCQVLNAADFGVAQSRRRLFVMGDKEGIPTGVALPRLRRREAAEVINPNGLYPFSPLRTPKRAIPTLERAQRAISEVGSKTPFLIVYYGTDGAGGWQRLDAPLRTITTLDRFAYVRPTARGHEMRMLQIPELKRAMGFPDSFRLDQGTRRDRIKLMGNAVSPPVMRAVIETLVRP